MIDDSTIRAILELIGNPEEVDRELRSFRRAARAFSSRHPRMIDAYPKQWIALFHGNVVARGATFDSVLAQIDEKKIPRGQVLIRYIDKNQRTMIL